MLLLLPGGTTWAQQRVADSLLLILEKHHREDTVRVNRMNDLAYAVYNNNSSMAEEYAREAGRLSDHLNYKKGKARSLWVLGLAHLGRDLGRYEKGDSCYNRALELAMALSDRQIEIKCLTNIARSHTGKGAYAPALELLQRAALLARELDDKPLLSRCYNNMGQTIHTLTNIGVVHSRRGEYALALGRFEETLRLSEEIGLKNLI